MTSQETRPIEHPLGRRRACIAIAATAVAGAVALPGCTLHRVDQRPSPVVAGPARYPASESLVPSAGGARKAMGDPWWRGFGDPRLDALMNRALARNFTVAEAAARVWHARATAGLGGSKLVPSVDLSGVTRVIEPGGTAVDVVGMVSWEIDLFGRLGSRDRAETHQMLATQDDLDAARVTLTADLAQVYYGASEHRQLIALLARQRRRATRLLGPVGARGAAGSRSSADVVRLRAQLLGVEAMIPNARAALRLDENRLDVLLGRPVDGRDRVAGHGFPPLPDVLPTGVPADLLVRRPDLRVLRHRLVASDHLIATAIAERLPRVELTGALVSGGSVPGAAASLLGELVKPLLEWGERKDAVSERRADHAAALAAFTNAYLEAISEVDGLLYQERCKREQIRLLEQQIKAYEESLSRAKRGYRRGRRNYLPLVMAVESLQEAERALLARRHELVSLRITLHRALGGALPGNHRRKASRAHHSKVSDRTRPWSGPAARPTGRRPAGARTRHGRRVASRASRAHPRPRGTPRCRSTARPRCVWRRPSSAPRSTG